MLPGVGFFPLSCVCRTYGNPLRVSAAPAGGKSWTCASNSSGAEIPVNAVEKAKSQLLIRIDARIIFFKNCTYLAPRVQRAIIDLLRGGSSRGQKGAFLPTSLTPRNKSNKNEAFDTTHKWLLTSAAASLELPKYKPELGKIQPIPRRPHPRKSRPPVRRHNASWEQFSG